MTSNGGLQRRRVTRTTDNLEEGTTNAPSRSLNGAAIVAVKSAKEFDRLSPQLTLMEEVLLLGLKDKQGYLSFWNDNISYALRGCIMLELALRNRISIVKDSTYSSTGLSDRRIELIDSSLTGEVLLDETIKLMKSTEERLSVNNWIDYLSGETWNLTKVGYQLKQVRERLAKGLVDKGVLRTEKRSFLIFDMATHPVSDVAIKHEILKRVSVTLLLTSDSALTTTLLDNPEETFNPVLQLRTILLICSAYAANVLENALWNMEFEEREKCLDKVEGYYRAYGTWPVAASARNAIEKCEMAGSSKGALEVISGVLEVMSKMDGLV